MAEVKNAFIKSKMNRDLDARLLPPGEYREGLNIQVSKSEGQDVGALENVIGNKLAPTLQGGGGGVDFNLISNVPADVTQLKSIGIHGDVNSGSIFVFLTNWKDKVIDSIPVNYSSSALNYIYQYNTISLTTTLLASGAFLNFELDSPIHGINIIDNLLFFTDNRNQPRKINISSLSNADGTSRYTTEENVSVAKYNPFQTIEMYYTLASINYTSMQDVTSAFLPNDVANPFLNAPLGQTIPNSGKWPGDPDFLEDKFVTFSYRFKFSDGEYSIMAPFTQPAFIPKQDGYFLTGDEDDAYRSTIVQFMENKVNNVGLYIPLPYSASTLEQNLHVIEIDVLYKESDGLAVKVLESVPSSVFSIDSSDLPNTTSKYLYQYQSRKPYKTLPEAEIIRVYDKVPVKAQGQEIISNRIVYSNFQDKHTPPQSLDYDIAVTVKNVFNINATNPSLSYTSSVEYPMHTIKKNRNYQVGIVLADKFGRQSSVLLSPVKTKQETDLNGVTYGGSTFYHPYNADIGALNDINQWPGDSLKLLINSPIPLSPNTNTSYPGVYDGNPGTEALPNPNYNPLGWYSYKVVVKQNEQDYYNVYTPGILNFYPNIVPPAATPDPANKVAFIVLINDNINKVPRDLIEVGPNQKQYRSSVELFGRVTPKDVESPNAITGNTGYYPVVNEVPKSNIVSTIALQDDMFDLSTGIKLGSVYQTESNPSIARMTQVPKAGVAVPTPPPIIPPNPPVIGSKFPLPQALATVQNILLGVFETAPVESLIDIFWETSTTGLVSEYNAAIEAGLQPSAFANFRPSDNGWTHDEATINSTQVIPDPLAALGGIGFYPTKTINLTAEPVAGNVTRLVSVYNAADPLTPITDNWKPLTRGADFSLADGSVVETWLLTVSDIPANPGPANPLYYYEDDARNTFIFNFEVTFDGVINDITETLVLGNKPPVITEAILPNSTVIPQNELATTPIILLPSRIKENAIITYYGINGYQGVTVNANAAIALQQKDQLKWSIVDGSQIPSPLATGIPNLTINESSGALFETTGTAEGNYSATVRLTDSGNAFIDLNVSVIFGKAQINTGFGKSALKEISKGMESAGVYWSNDYSQTSVIENTNPKLNNTTTGRAVFAPDASGNNGLNLSPTLTSSRDTKNKVDPNNPAGQDWRWYNTNYRPDYFNSGITPTGLTKGTAFIRLEYKFIQSEIPATLPNTEGGGFARLPNNDEQVGAMWPSYLQYRATSSDTWVYAIDIEGQTIKIGGQQANSISTGDNFKLTGFTSNATQSSQAPVLSGLDRVDTKQVTTTFPQIRNTVTLTSVSNEIYAIGEDQGGYGTSTKYGEYRIVIRYPSGHIGFQAVPFRLNLPTPGGNTMGNPYFTGNGNRINNLIGVKLSFGDFYYPQGVAASNSYSYFISSSSSIDALTASDKTPTVTVHAREWSLKYVSQLYSDSNLTTPITTANLPDGYYSYSATSPGNYNSSNGTGNSYVLGTEVNMGNIPNNPVPKRRWTGNFVNGKKVAGSALPNTVVDLGQ